MYIGIPEQGGEDIALARGLAREWGWNHHVLRVGDRHLTSALLHQQETLEEPIGDRSMLNSWMGQLVSPRHRVALGGDGGDELFFGVSKILQCKQKLEAIGLRGNWLGNISERPERMQ